VIYGFVIDRVAEDGSLPPVEPSRPGKTLFEQFPMNCGMTQILRHADVRRSVAYRGYLRTELGHHIMLGVNDSAAPLTPERAESMGRSLLHRARQAFGPELFGISPYAKEEYLPHLNFWFHFVSVFHFKWNAGLRARFGKLRTQGWEEYAGWTEFHGAKEAVEGLAMDESGVAEGIPVEKMCVRPRAGQLRTALTAMDMLKFLSNWGKDTTAADWIQRIWKDRGQTNPLYRDYDLRLNLYIMFLYHYDFGIHDALRMISRMQ